MADARIAQIERQGATGEEATVRIRIGYSVVIPAYNEMDNVEPLYDEIVAVMDGLDDTYEILFINDGSTDYTNSVLNRLADADSAVRVLHLEANCGKTAALDAGFRAARGEFLIMMDADRQNDPRDIPRFLALQDSADLVCGVRSRRRDTIVKRVSSRVSNRVRRMVCGDCWRDINCGFKLLRRSCLQEVKLYRGMHRFLPVLFEMKGFCVAEVEIADRPRVAGKSKYGLLNRLVGPFLDMLAVRWMQKARLNYRLKSRDAR